jgi:hypothetical protein
VVGPYSCASRSNTQNLVKIFEGKIKLLNYEVYRPQYDLMGFVRDHLKLRHSYRHVLDIEDYWSECLNEYQTREKLWSRLTLDEIKMYNNNIDVSDLADDGLYMHPSAYDQIKVLPISSSPPIGPVIDSLELLMRSIIKRTDKWMEWTRARRKRTIDTGSSRGATSGAEQTTPAATSSVATLVLTGPT